MAAKFITGRRILAVVQLLVCLVASGVVRAVDDGTVYLDLKEQYVRGIASSAQANQMICGNLDGCDKACTRAVCYPISGEKTAQCSQVDNNEYCQLVNASTCKYMILDYTQIFTTLPPPGDIERIQPEVARDICLQKALESTFKNITKPSFGNSEYSLVYYGAVSGAWVSLPGRESNCSIPYDTRKRPWYLDGISLMKEVKILIDVGSTMATPVSPDYGRPPGYTYLNLTQDTTQELLQTFSSQDYVEVITFDALRATSLGAPVNIMPYDSFDPSGRPELVPLVGKVGSLESSPEVAPSVLDTAVAKAASSFVSANTSSYLKIIIVLTNGLFAPLNSTALGFSSKAVTDLRAKLMIFKLPPNQQDRFLTSTTLKQNLCSVNGSFEVLVPLETLNPLYAVRSYFTYLARVHLAAGDRPNWSNTYESYSQLHNISTVTYPVFGNDSLLLGVAAIDVAIADLPSTLQTLVLNDLPNRSQGTLPAPVTFPITCDYQVADRAATCPKSLTSPIDVAVCKQTDFTTTVSQRTCCNATESQGTCAVPVEPPPPPSPGGGGGGWPWWAYLAIVVGAVLLIGLLVGLVIWCWRREDIRIPSFRGDDDVIDYN